MIRSFALFALFVLPWFAAARLDPIWSLPAYLLACAQALWGAWVAVAPGQRPDHWSQAFFLAGVIGSAAALPAVRDHVPLVIAPYIICAPFGLLWAYSWMKNKRRKNEGEALV